MDENSKIWILVPDLKYTGSGLQRVKRCKEIAPCKQLFTVTELFNIIANGFDAQKSGNSNCTRCTQVRIGHF